VYIESVVVLVLGPAVLEFGKHVQTEITSFVKKTKKKSHKTLVLTNANMYFYIIETCLNQVESNGIM
jgi:hypothetical protein